jgi:hypothetical protein
MNINVFAMVKLMAVTRRCCKSLIGLLWREFEKKYGYVWQWTGLEEVD